MPRQTRPQRSPDYQKGYSFGYMNGVKDLAELIANIVSVGQFHEIAEKWEQFKRQREQEVVK